MRRREVMVDLTDDLEEAQAQAQAQAEPAAYNTRRQARATLDDVPVLSYPQNDPNAVTLTNHDMIRLGPEQFLNDSLIDFYCRWVEEKRKQKLRARGFEDQEDRIHIFTSFLYAKLALGYEPSTEAVKWCGKMDIFEKDFLLFPVCQKLHWSLVLVCFPSEIGNQHAFSKGRSVPCLLHFNSIRKNLPGVSGHIRTFLQLFWDKRHKATKGTRRFDKESMPGYVSVCPQQNNEWDCGIFLLEFIKRICLGGAEGEEPTLQELLKKQDPLTFFDRPKWFRAADIGQRRKEFRELVESIQDEMVSLNSVSHEQPSAAGSAPARPRSPSAVVQGPETRLRELAAWREQVDEQEVDEEQVAELLKAERRKTAKDSTEEADSLVGVPRTWMAGSSGRSNSQAAQRVSEHKEVESIDVDEEDIEASSPKSQANTQPMDGELCSGRKRSYEDMEMHADIL